ncbi:hypothetical protein FMN50_22265 [Rhodobacterales bacterium]|nr:hypothetical protein FMN50_22265 [Rhodobacterales bacterium]
MRAETIRFLIQATFAFAAIALVVLVEHPYGVSLGFFMLVSGLWLGRRVFMRIARPDEVRADLRGRVDMGP